MFSVVCPILKIKMILNKEKFVLFWTKVTNLKILKQPLFFTTWIILKIDITPNFENSTKNHFQEVMCESSQKFDRVTFIIEKWLLMENLDKIIDFIHHKYLEMPLKHKIWWFIFFLLGKILNVYWMNYGICK